MSVVRQRIDNDGRIEIRALLALACVLAVGVPLAAGLVRTTQGQRPGAGAAEKGGIAGTWQGTMRTPDGHNLRVVLKIAKDQKGGLSATLDAGDGVGDSCCAIAGSADGSGCEARRGGGDGQADPAGN